MGNASILIVEDEAIIAAELASQLHKLGYKVTGPISRGEDAVAMVQRERPSLIMMDIRLAGKMDGIESAIAIRQQVRLPVVFLTAHCDAATLERAGHADAFGYILKPFEECDLRIHIEMALRRYATEQRLWHEKEQLEGRVKTTERALGRTKEELRGLAASLITAQEEERRRVSRELHDDLGQKVALIELNAASLEQELKQAPAEVRAELTEMRKQTSQLAQDLRGIAYQLHPAILDDLGLSAALKRLIDTWQQHEQLPVRFESLDVPPRIPPAIAGALYRITQEALHNIAKHAGKTRVTVSLRGIGRRLRLRVRDYGHGFDALAVRGRGGMGILNMEERTRLIEGKFQLRASPGRGVSICVEVALPPAGRKA